MGGKVTFGIGATAGSSGTLSRHHRRLALEAMAGQELDVLVVGGGVVGSGTALDAVTRGLTVGLVEARDLASGTSSRSSKLIHGGLRYLEQLNFALVREALGERGLLLDTLCPHLVKPVPFLYPLTHRGWERLYVGSGIALYDLMAARSGHSAGLPRHRHLSRRGALARFPSLRADSLVGAIEYYDAQVDDARHTLTVARTAAVYGAHVATRAQVVKFLREGERVTGAVVEDLEHPGERIEIRARQVVNATGVWTDQTQSLIAERGQIKVRASKGIHLVVPRDRIQAETGLIVRTEKSVLFVIPWGRHWIIGTTDTDWDLDKAHPAASQRDIDYLLDHVNEVLATPLSAEDVEGVYAGLRPLLVGESEASSKLSREHRVAHPVPGLVVIAGGKYTTYRVMAKDAVDAAVHGLGSGVPPSCTEHIPLLGAEGYRALVNQRDELAGRYGLHPSRIDRLLGRYGSLIHQVLAPLTNRPDLAEPLAGADDYLRAEVVYAAAHEAGFHLEDVLTRRTRISIETWDRGLSAAPEVADLMGGELDWGEDQIRLEVTRYEARVAAERESQHQQDDLSADVVRLSAADIVATPPLSPAPAPAPHSPPGPSSAGG
jgi:glycerol-3-phosphate dehydrogenase